MSQGSCGIAEIANLELGYGWWDVEIPDDCLELFAAAWLGNAMLILWCHGPVSPEQLVRTGNPCSPGGQERAVVTHTLTHLSLTSTDCSRMWPFCYWQTSPSNFPVLLTDKTRAESNFVPNKWWVTAYKPEVLGVRGSACPGHFISVVEEAEKAGVGWWQRVVRLLCAPECQPLGTGHKSDPAIIATHGFVVSHQSQGKMGKICIILVELCSVNGTTPQLGGRMLMGYTAIGRHNLQRGISSDQLVYSHASETPWALKWG